MYELESALYGSDKAGDLLEDGWEPFGVAFDGFTYVYFRRRTDPEWDQNC